MKNLVIWKRAEIILESKFLIMDNIMWAKAEKENFTIDRKKENLSTVTEMLLPIKSKTITSKLTGAISPGFSNLLLMFFLPQLN